MNVLHDALPGLPPLLVYTVVSVMITLEAAIVLGVVLPGASILPLFGFLAYLGKVDLVPAMATAAGAALAGTTIAYTKGRRLGRAGGLPDSRLARRIGEERWRSTEALLDRFGGRAVLIGQWVVGARTLVPRLAGMAGIPYRRFGPWNVPVCLAWGSAWVLVGWAAGSAYERVAAVAGWVSLVLLAVLVTVVATLLRRRTSANGIRPAFSPNASSRLEADIRHCSR